jgi:hypothetical protein
MCLITLSSLAARWQSFFGHLTLQSAAQQTLARIPACTLLFLVAAQNFMRRYAALSGFLAAFINLSAIIRLFLPIAARHLFRARPGMNDLLRHQRTISQDSIRPGVLRDGGSARPFATQQRRLL